jgi:hypothetical protein
MQPEFRRDLPMVKSEIADDKIASHGDRGVIRRGPMGSSKRRIGCSPKAQTEKHENGWDRAQRDTSCAIMGNPHVRHSWFRTKSPAEKV